jgi:DHA1 family inner membrane transport protein
MYLPLFALLLGAFCIGTTELVVAGILPAIATDLGVSIPRAGMLVTGYAVAVAIGGPLMMAVAGRWPRKRGIVGVTLVFALGHLLCGFAPSFAMLMAGRVIAAAAHGCFFGFAIVLATAGVPLNRRATALSIVVGGVNIANVIGVPLGTAVGNAYGWRATFLMIAACALVAAAAIALLVRDTSPARTSAPLGRQIRALMNRTVITAYAMVVLQMTAVFTLLTFIAPYMAEVAGIGPEGLPGVLLLSGLAGTVGVFVGGSLVDRAPKGTLILSYAIATATMVVVWLGTPQSAAVGVAAFAAASLAGNISSLAAQHRILVGSIKAPELASTLMSTVFNTGIAAGAGLGAGLIASGAPWQALPIVGVATFTLATLIALTAVFDSKGAGLAGNG